MFMAPSGLSRPRTSSSHIEGQIGSPVAHRGEAEHRARIVACRSPKEAFMLSLRSLLVPVDLSLGSAEALRYALAMRRGERGIARGARIEVLRVVDLDPLRPLEREKKGTIDAVRDEVATLLRRFVVDIAGHGEPAIDTAVVDGEPREAIPERARAFDTVVIGAVSRRDVRELVPGGVAEATVRRSPVPVIVAKWRSAISGVDAGAPLGLREIVFATDCTAHSAFALRQAMAFAFAYGARVTALYVARSANEIEGRSRMPLPLSEEIDDFYEKDLGWQRDELGRFLRDRLGADRPVDIREVVRVGEPAEEIAAQCYDVGADLLVMATHGRSGLERAILGSVAEKALRLAPCPVLTVRPAEI
jgi:nucleotide-binding universal stress UspA family protein